MYYLVDMKIPEGTEFGNFTVMYPKGKDREFNDIVILLCSICGEVTRLAYTEVLEGRIGPCWACRLRDDRMARKVRAHLRRNSPENPIPLLDRSPGGLTVDAAVSGHKDYVYAYSGKGGVADYINAEARERELRARRAEVARRIEIDAARDDDVLGLCDVGETSSGVG